MRSLLFAVAACAAPGAAAMAEFHWPDVAVPGGSLDVRVASTVSREKAREILEWVRTTASDVSLVYGRFPLPDVRVVVMPSRTHARGGGSPVPFGRVTRRGGETVELYIDADRPTADLYGDWTATHEFSHLMLPRLQWRHRWISEGFASYYQNVLMARAGRYTQAQAWEKLVAGLERGHKSQPALSPNAAAAEGMRRARMKIYWSGAAIALMADVRLRERSHGGESLDTVLGRFQACCLPSDSRWDGVEWFRTLDSLLDEPVFMPLYDAYADAPGFPDVFPLLARLGVSVDGRGAALARDAELAGIRESIVSPRINPH